MIKNNKRNNLREGSVFAELNLTLVEVTPVNAQDCKEIKLMALECGEDKELHVFGWLSQAGIFYFHRLLTRDLVARIEKELLDMGYHVKPRAF